jgi:hypothetical protein
MLYRITFPLDTSDARQAALMLSNTPGYRIFSQDKHVIQSVAVDGAQPAGNNPVLVEASSESIENIRFLVTSKGGSISVVG